MVLFANAGHARLRAPARLCSPHTATNPTRHTTLHCQTVCRFLPAMWFVSPVTSWLFQVCINKWMETVQNESWAGKKAEFCAFSSLRAARRILRESYQPRWKICRVAWNCHVFVSFHPLLIYAVNWKHNKAVSLSDCTFFSHRAPPSALLFHSQRNT